MDKPKLDGPGRRSEIVTIRLEPKLKYLAELCSRKQRRTLSSFIEWAVERSFQEVTIEDDFQGNTVSVAEAEKKHNLWDVDEFDRVAKLAINYPELLTLEEQILWKRVRESEEGNDITHLSFLNAFTSGLNEKLLNWQLLRERWELIRAEAKAHARHRQKPENPSEKNS